MPEGWFSRGYLPHVEAPGLIQMVTFRLMDSMPASLRHEWGHLLDLQEGTAHKREQIQGYLDAGRGACWLADPRIADFVQTELLRWDGDRYRLIAWVIMPNHVHTLIEPVAGSPVSVIVQQWKGASARAANLALGRSGAFWFREYFDRYIRDDPHLVAGVRYIHQNPVKVGLVKLEEDYRWSSAWKGWKQEAG